MQLHEGVKADIVKHLKQLTYLCEIGFSALMVIKTKYRQRLNVENDLRLKLSPIFPAISDLCSNKQGDPSH
ncbi:SCND3 protein, partial [Polyodon spathula]|nr:SCND3 protein [Polyodon spathula]